MKEKLKNLWAIEVEEGRLARISIGNMELNALKKREQYRAIIKNIPSSAMECLLLRQLKKIFAKNVHIRRNSNRNQSNIAIVDFESKKDKEEAMKYAIIYNYTRLR